MAKVLGMNAKAYRCATLIDGSANTPALATWVLVDNIRDLSISLEVDEADVTTRANSGWKATLPSLRSGSIDFEMVWDTSDANFTALQTAFLTGAEIGFTALDGLEATAGSQGLAGNFSVVGFSRNEPLGEAVTVSVSLKPSSFTSWYTAA